MGKEGSKRGLRERGEDGEWEGRGEGKKTEGIVFFCQSQVDRGPIRACPRKRGGPVVRKRHNKPSCEEKRAKREERRARQSANKRTNCHLRLVAHLSSLKRYGARHNIGIAYVGIDIYKGEGKRR